MLKIGKRKRVDDEDMPAKVSSKSKQIKKKPQCKRLKKQLGF